MTPPGKQDAVLAAALSVFAERTVAAARVPDLADRAGVGVGTLYRYFDGKDALANAVFRRAKGSMEHALFSGLDADASPERQFAQLWHGLGRFAVGEPDSFAFLELQDHTGYLDDESRAVDADLRARARAAVEQLQASHLWTNTGSGRPPEPMFVQRCEKVGGEADLVVALVLGAMVGLFRSARAGEVELTPDVLERAGALVWRMVAGRT